MDNVQSLAPRRGCEWSNSVESVVDAYQNHIAESFLVVDTNMGLKDFGSHVVRALLHTYVTACEGCMSFVACCWLEPSLG